MGLLGKAETCAKASKTSKVINIQSIKRSSPEVDTIRHSPRSAPNITILSASPTCSKKKTFSTMKIRFLIKLCQAKEL